MAAIILSYHKLQETHRIHYDDAADASSAVPFCLGLVLHFNCVVNAQHIYGTPAAYQLGQGTQRKAHNRDHDLIPIHEAVDQELQADLFSFLGQVFLLTISVVLGLIMVTHLSSVTLKTRFDKKKKRKEENINATIKYLFNTTYLKAF